MSLYVSGHLNTVFHAEHRREILRYIYYHQVPVHKNVVSTLSLMNPFVSVCLSAGLGNLIPEANICNMH